MFCPRAGPSQQAQEPRLQFYQGWIDAIATRCFPHPTLSLASEQKLKIWKIPGAPTWRWGEWIWLTGSSGLHRNSPQGLNIRSIRVFDQIRDLEIPIPFAPIYIYIYIYKCVCVFVCFNWLFIVSLAARSYRGCHLLGMSNFRSSDFTAIC